MFRRLHESPSRLRLVADGREIEAVPGDSVAAALLAASIDTFRHTVRSGSARGPYCGMGVCFECLVTIDGEANRQACLVPVRAGMVVVTGGAAPSLAADAAT